MNKSKYSPEVIERSVRMVMEARNEYSSQWAAIESIAGKIGCTAETLRRWVRQHETDTGLRNGVTTAEQERIRTLEREVKELRKANEILRLASAHKDEQLSAHIHRIWHANMQVYGAEKVWRQLKREQIQVARCTVERLMRCAGLRGAIRGKAVRTTVSNPAAPCPLDQLWVSDFTYVQTRQGMIYVAFVIDVFARRIVGWRVSSSMHTEFVLDALEQALYARQPARGQGLIHHSDRGSQYVSVRYSERLTEAGIEPSVGSRGDSDDNALAEAINGLYKTELIKKRAPWKTREAVELATLEWVSWFNHRRLMGAIGHIPPAEAEMNYFQQLSGQAIPA